MRGGRGKGGEGGYRQQEGVLIPCGKTVHEWKQTESGEQNRSLHGLKVKGKEV